MQESVFFWPYCLEISNKSGCIFVYIKSNTPTCQLNCRNFCNSIQAVPLEINSRKEKWLVISIYRPPSQNSEFSKRLIKYHKLLYKNFWQLYNHWWLKQFLDSNGLYNLFKRQTCFRNSDSLTDLILTNSKYFFNDAHSFETSLSDHNRRMVYTMLKTTFRNLNRNNRFTEILRRTLLKVSKTIYWKIWLKATDHLLNLIKNLHPCWITTTRKKNNFAETKSRRWLKF